MSDSLKLTHSVLQNLTARPVTSPGVENAVWAEQAAPVAHGCMDSIDAILAPTAPARKHFEKPDNNSKSAPGLRAPSRKRTASPAPENDALANALFGLLNVDRF